MKIGSVRVKGDFRADAWQRIYSKEVAVNEGLDIYDKLCSHFDGADGAVAYTDPIAGAFTFAGLAQLDTAQKKFGSASLLLAGLISNANLYSSDMSSISGWDTALCVGSGTVTQTTFDSKSCMKVACTSTSSRAIARQDLGTFGSRTVASFSVYCDLIGVQSTENGFRATFYQGSYACSIVFASDGLFVYNGSSFVNLGASLVTQDVWTEWTVDIDWTNRLVDIWKNGIKVVSAASCNWAYSAIANGYVRIWQDGMALANTVSYVDWYYVGDGTVASESTPNGLSCVTLPDSDNWNFGTGDFTIDGWIKRKSNGGNQFILCQGDSSGTDASISFGFWFSSDKLTGWLYDSAHTRYTVQSTGTITDSNWHHVAFIRDGNYMKLYLDGVNDGSTDITGVTANNSSNILTVGRMGEYNGNYFNGCIDELRICKGTARWNSNFTPPTKEYGVTSIVISGLKGNILQNSDLETWTAGVSSAPDGWVKYGAGATIARESTIIKINDYSAKLTRSGANAYLTQAVHEGRGIDYWRGKNVTFGAWVYATEASRVQLFWDDGASTHTSSYHTGDSTWQWLTISDTVNASATILELSLRVITGDTSGYIDGAICLEGEFIIPTDSSNIKQYCLNGNTQEEYLLRTYIVNGYDGGPNFYIRFNADSGANYGQQILYGASTSIGAARATANTSIVVFAGSARGDSGQANLKIYAKIGYLRLVISDSTYRISGTTVTLVAKNGQSWNNTADNISRIDLVSDQSNGLGVGSRIELYAKGVR